MLKRQHQIQSPPKKSFKKINGTSTYNVFNSFFENESDILDEDEDENMRWSNENDSNDPETLECDITEAEEYEAIRILKNGKAPGPNWLIGEFFKNSAAHVVPFLVRYFNKLFSSGLYPDDWSIIQPVFQKPVFQKGDPDIPDNYRGISLLSICSKLYSYILNLSLIHIWRCRR